MYTVDVLSSPEPKALGELIEWDSSWRLSNRAFTLSDMDISETSWSNIIKFHLKHYWGRGSAALGFGPDRIRTLVSMATDSSHRVIIGYSCEHSSSSIFHWIFFILAGNNDSNKSLDRVSKIGPGSAKLATFDCMKTSP